MNIKRFKRISKFLSIIFNASAFLIVLVTMFFVLILFSKNNYGFEFVLNEPSIIIFQNSHLHRTEDLFKIAEKVSFYILPLILLILLYIFLKGGKMFKNLSNGITPFNSQFARDIKQLGLILIISDIGLPILYSIIFAIISKDKYHIILGISYYFFFGLFFYLVSEILNYGISLQELSDETV